MKKLKVDSKSKKEVKVKEKKGKEKYINRYIFNGYPLVTKVPLGHTYIHKVLFLKDKVT